MVRITQFPLAVVVFFALVSSRVLAAEPVATAFNAAEEVTCECENSTCGACEVETGVSFYSAKCGPGNKQVKSCKKPSCVAVENQKQCLAQLKGAESQKASSSQAASAGDSSSREPASALVQAGSVSESTGSARILRAPKGNAEAVVKGAKVFVGDLIETKTDGRVKVTLNDAENPSASSEVIVPSDSKVKIERFFADPAAARRQILLKLLQGKVRSQVNQKYEGDNTYRVQTRTAVAGVRGTDFVVTFAKNDKEWVSQVQTLHGQVRLEGARNAKDSAMPKMIDIPAGGYASIVVAAPVDDTSEVEVDRAIEEGQATPVYKMKDDEMQTLDRETGWAAVRERIEAQSRAVASVSDTVCQAPAGEYNQCSYTCEGNPEGAKTCRTDLPSVSCVRRLCRANGQWEEERRLPASQADQCESGSRPVVKSCGSYW